MFLFIGEARSDKAVAMGVTWKDGRLAARTLFAALQQHGIDPNVQRYENWFKDGVKPLRRRWGILERVREAVENGTVVVALGKRVSRELERYGFPHLKLIHPAARGKIRLKSAYHKHVGQVLKV